MKERLAAPLSLWGEAARRERKIAEGAFSGTVLVSAAAGAVGTKNAGVTVRHTTAPRAQRIARRAVLHLYLDEAGDYSLRRSYGNQPTACLSHSTAAN